MCVVQLLQMQWDQNLFRQLHFPFLGKSHVRFTVSLQEIMATQFKVQNKRVCVCNVTVSYLIDVLISFDEVNREFSQWSAGRVSETRGNSPLEYGHIRQHLQRTTTFHKLVSGLMQEMFLMCVSGQLHTKNKCVHSV